MGIARYLSNHSSSDHERENMQPAVSAGNHATCNKRGKTCNWCKAQENM